MSEIQDTAVFNTLTRKRDTIRASETCEPGKLKMYSCGPTVYGDIHIGNLMAALVADLFFRYFKKIGYDVTYVRNYTDIDDKIIKRANEEGITTEEVTKKYIVEVERVYAAADIQNPTHKTLATEHIPEMITMIQQLIENGHAYVAEDGEVIYSIESFSGYGKLSKKAIDELEAGARVEVSDKKKNPFDFTLWKPAKPGEPSWKSPWCEGRPGWHIECSVMASKWMGDQIDIHHGAVDLIFPHHENEIAQTEGASGKDPFVKYWLHNSHLMMDKEKMSKSLGNVLLAKDFLGRFNGEVARFMLLSFHYRSDGHFGKEMIDQALHGLTRIYEAKKKAVLLSKLKAMVPDPMAESAWGEFVAHCEKTRKDIMKEFASDFNTPGALGALFTLIREFNRVCAIPSAESTPAAVLGANELVKIIESDVGDILGVGKKEPSKALDELNEIKGRESGSGVSAEEIEKLIVERAQARKSKNFARADEIRDDLLKKGVVLKDSGGKTTWEYQ